MWFKSKLADMKLRKSFSNVKIKTQFACQVLTTDRPFVKDAFPLGRKLSMACRGALNEEVSGTKNWKHAVNRLFLSVSAKE